MTITAERIDEIEQELLAVVKAAGGLREPDKEVIKAIATSECFMHSTEGISGFVQAVAAGPLTDHQRTMLLAMLGALAHCMYEVGRQVGETAALENMMGPREGDN